MSLRFFRRIHFGRFFTVNLSKGGVSASVGVPGAKVTSGTSGSRVTVGIPGTGLFYTKKLRLDGTVDLDARTAANRAFFAGLKACHDNPHATPTDIAAALNAQASFGLSDTDLTPEILELVTLHREELSAMGYRIVTTGQSAPVSPVRPSAWRTVVVIVIAFALFASGIAGWIAVTQ